MTRQPGEESPVELPEDVERPEEDDHDLLTFGEAGVRLREEIAGLRRAVAALETGPADAPELVRSRERLAALQEGSERNRAQPINDENFENFFGYPGQARRNTTW